jgi:cation diffusion facilitator family transporter
MRDVERVREPRHEPERHRLYQRAIWIAIVGNTLLAGAKVAAAVVSGSTAALATAVDSLTDLVYTAAMAWGLHLSRQPADPSHPHGHSRIEPLVSAAIGIAMGIAGAQVIRRAINQLMTGEPPIFNWGFPAAVLLGGALAKFVMYLLVRSLGDRARSPAIRAFARDNLTDVLSSTSAFVGVAVAHYVHPLADPIAGIVVSLWIFRNALGILVENVGYLTGRAPSEHLFNEIHDAACSVPGVVEVHRVVASYVGPDILVDLHVDVDGNLPLHRAHDISEQVRIAVEALDEVDQAFVHLEPASES